MQKNRIELRRSFFLGGLNSWVMAKICVIVFGSLALFFDDFVLIFSDAFQKVTSIYVIAVPFILVYLIYHKRKMLDIVLPLNSGSRPRRFKYLSLMAGALLLFTGVLLYWHGSYTSVALTYHMVALPTFVAGLVLFLFGPQALGLLVFPLVLLFFMVPPPSAVFAVVWIITLIGFLAVTFRLGKIINPRVSVHKLGNCSRCSPIRSGSLFFCVQCGKVIGAESVASMKEKIKLIVVIVTVLLLLFFQVPFLAIARTSDVVIANSPMGRQEPTKPLPEVLGYTLQFSYRDTEFEEFANVDMALAYIYTPQEENSRKIWVSVEAASELYRLHQWETDLISIPLSQNQLPRVVQHETKAVLLSENPAMPGQFFAFQYKATGQKQAVLYWYDVARFATNSTSEQKNVGISLVTYPNSWEELPEVETQLKTLAKPIVNYWQSLKISSPISIAISQMGTQFAGITFLLTAILLVFYFIELKRQERIAERVYHKLSSANKYIMKVIKETQDKTGSILSTIVDFYRKGASEKVNSDYLLGRLEKLEKVGIIKSEIAYINDEPILVWKTWI